MKRALPYAAGGALLGGVAGLSFGMGNYLATWLLWFLYFSVVELRALFNSREGDTLSEHVWQWFAVGGGRPVTGWVRLRRVVLLGFVVWLGVHFVGGGVIV
ncbi:hypothetical protein DER29_0458 [Micromonospora sp. M71_S20]|uniref:hypothetical protein n=1 Tax=Micromonospora sp. M71_S20 TaxID=592872 RepID=UPI000EABFE78|nr:hypothetical protein [Micromonospora sp. M71_S20]RLK22621.1 hypothetical protein DER29_0458 [Micromonospora sp. M71_S20]